MCLLSHLSPPLRLHFSCASIVTSAKQKPAEKPSAAGGEHDGLPTHVEPMQVASAKVQQYSKCSAPVVSMHASGESRQHDVQHVHTNVIAHTHCETLTKPATYCHMCFTAPLLV